ncbi:hypothetical protein ACQEVC_45445 [Plantactinospora sp. CA-294935]|uniref:hypothetical protein n=1 Tax=Plantactinospora sp. CA-294935 TaxID=3240012 RepID=UPI003D939776
MRRILVVGRNPFEAAVLAASAVAGASLIAAGQRPRSVAEAMPPLLQDTWEIALVLAGVVGLVGIYWPGPPLVGVGSELSALVVLGTATTMYAIALFAISGWQALAAGAFITAIGVASWWRTALIVRDLRRLARHHDATEGS